MHDERLHLRLVEWADEYGGGRYEDLGYPARNTLHKVIEMGGYVPNAAGRIRCAERTPADEVDAIVRQLAVEHWREMQVLRVDYFRPNIAMETRLALLGRVGCGMGRTSYFERLRQAKELVSEALALLRP